MNMLLTVTTGMHNPMIVIAVVVIFLVWIKLTSYMTYRLVGIWSVLRVRRCLTQGEEVFFRVDKRLLRFFWVPATEDMCLYVNELYFKTRAEAESYVTEHEAFKKKKRDSKIIKVE